MASTDRTPGPFAETMSLRSRCWASHEIQMYADGQLKWIIENGIFPSGMPRGRDPGRRGESGRSSITSGISRRKAAWSADVSMKASVRIRQPFPAHDGGDIE